MAYEGNDPLLRSDRTRRSAGQIRPLVLLVLLLAVLVLIFWGGGDGHRDGVRRAHGWHSRRIWRDAGVQAVRVLPVWIFLCLAEQHHGYAVAGGVRDVGVRGRRVREYMVICAKQRLLDLGYGQLGRRSVRRRRPGISQRGGQVPLGGRGEVGKGVRYDRRVVGGVGGGDTSEGCGGLGPRWKQLGGGGGLAGRREGEELGLRRRALDGEGREETGYVWWGLPTLCSWAFSRRRGRIGYGR